MDEIRLKAENIDVLNLSAQLEAWLKGFSFKPKKVLLIPPDITRSYSKAGLITQLLYKLLEPDCHVDILPALGTHMPMNEEEINKMFGEGIPSERFLMHDWRNEIVKIGEIPPELVADVSEGLLNYSINVEINQRLLDPGYDQIISIGQIVPNEIVGMGGYTKNILVGCGGEDIINKTHFLGAAYGMEKIMGRAETPVRKIFDYVEEHFINKIPLNYILTVTTTFEEETKLRGLFIGRSHELFLDAVKLSQRYNMNLLDQELKKVVVYIEPGEFKTTWLGDKSIYRTRMAIADGGELIIIAPGVTQFGEDKEIDQLIRKYGHVGSKAIIKLVEENEDLKNNLSAAAHLIHGSSEGRFKITYATNGLSKDELEQVKINYMPLDEALKRYSPDNLKDGYNIMSDGEEVFFVSNPALGLWALRKKFTSEE